MGLLGSIGPVRTGSRQWAEGVGWGRVLCRVGWRWSSGRWRVRIGVVGRLVVCVAPRREGYAVSRPRRSPKRRWKARKLVVSRFASRTERFIPGGPRPDGPAGVLCTDVAGRWLNGATLLIAPCGRGVCKQPLGVELCTARCLCVCACACVCVCCVCVCVCVCVCGKNCDCNYITWWAVEGSDTFSKVQPVWHTVAEGHDTLVSQSCFKVDVRHLQPEPQPYLCLLHNPDSIVTR